MNENSKNAIIVGAILLLGGAIIVSGIFGIWYLGKKVSIWSQSMSGQAELAKAEANRKIIIVEAESKQQAAKYTAQADIIRAQGIAQANKIIGQSLEQNQDYLIWKFIDELPQQKNQIIYLPTNAFLPITEANRGAK